MGKRNRRRGCKYPIRRDETKGEGEEEERSEISRFNGLGYKMVFDRIVSRNSKIKSFPSISCTAMKYQTISSGFSSIKLNAK